MRLRHLAATVALSMLSIICGAHAHAQTAIYAQATGQSNNLTSGDGYFWGPTFGIYHDSHRLALVHIGYDVRGSILKNGSAQFSSGLGGIRASVVPHVIPIKIYGEVLGGVGFISNGSSSTNFQYQINGGLEYTLLPHIDWRALEVAYNGYSGSSVGNPVALSTGIVFRL